MNQPTAMLCPSPERLAQLAAGSLMESEAERLFHHIDGCSSCQFQIDELAKGNDPVLKAAKHAPRHETPPTQDAHLSELILNAQKGASRQDTRAVKDSATKPISEIDFVDGLRRSGLMPQDEIDQLLMDLSWDRSKSHGDSSSLAKRLIRSEKLTQFQAKLLLRGRWKGLVLGNYTILDKLGQGGMGSVFKARHTRMGRTVCLKVVNAAGRQSPDVIERFRNEARALASLTHPNIVVAHDANETRGIPYLVMEYIDGADLSKRIKKNGPLSVVETLDIASQTARALAYAHSQGVIHRDVKPHNIVADRSRSSSDSTSSRVKVLDLGLARLDTLVTDNPDASILAAMTNTGVVIGTVDYMSPEQALDSRNADARSDIYSLGCTLYYLLIGRPPFQGETVMQRLVAHREERPRSLCSFMKSDITPALNEVVQMMLRKDPDERYQSMDDVVQDLEALRDGRPTVASVTARSKPKPSPTPPPIVDDRTPGAIDEVPKLIDDEAAHSSGILLPVYGRTLVAATLLSLCVIGPIVLLWPQVDPVEIDIPTVRVGAQRAIRNGGDGRALLVLSSKKFHKDEFQVMIDLLEKRNVEIVAASPNYGTEHHDYGGELKTRFLNINLIDARPDEYDAIFLLGGDVYDLTHKNKQNHAHVKRIIDGALINNVSVGSCSNGCDPLFDGTRVHDKQFQSVMKRKTHNKEELVKFAREVFDKLKPISDA